MCPFMILNGNEYAQRQAAKAGIGFVPLDNAFAVVDEVAAVQAICDGLDEGKITALAALTVPCCENDVIGTVVERARLGKASQDAQRASAAAHGEGYPRLVAGTAEHPCRRGEA